MRLRPATPDGLDVLRRWDAAPHIITSKGLLGVPERRITVVHNGIALERWTPAAAPGDRSALADRGLRERGYLLYAGDADWRKNHEGMLAGLATSRSDATLAWAGQLSEERRRMIREDARRHGIAHRLALLGHVDDAALAALYRGALATLFVSRAEGFGLPVVEAMACGSPVITSDRSSLAEIAEGAALLVDPESPAAIGAAIASLTDDALRARLRGRGLERARRFSLEEQARATREVYRGLLR
jgi:glycosyltransferase involved in cell wall biosynthesis